MKIQETELAKHIIAWLTDQHWTIYQEVQFSRMGGIADIVAERNGILWIIETKTSYGFAVLEQAAAWPVHYRSVGVPWARNRDYRVATGYYRVGVIEVTGYEPIVREVERAPLFRRHKSNVNRLLDQLTDLHKTFAAAGSRGGGHLTPYKMTMMDVKKTIEANPGCTIRFLFEQLGKMHYSSRSSFTGNLLSALLTFESHWCRVDTSVRPYQLFIRSDVGEVVLT